MSKTIINLGGVPEHFNYPWHLADEEAVFDEIDLELNFIDFPGGTGAMMQALLAKEIDLALLLTEGAIKFISENSSYKIIKVYVKSPLIWGVYQAFTSASEASTLPFAISRYGSGSHLMAYVHAQNKGWNIDQLNFEVIDNLNGLRKAYREGLDALFLWEKTTSQPFVDSKELKLIDTCPTPWPCFVLVGHEDYINKEAEDLETFLDAINMCLDNFKDRPELIEEIADAYELKLEEVEEWISKTEWDSSLDVSKEMLSKVIATLNQLGVLKNKITPQQLLSSITNPID
jgi:ABC-type nitrate/sulfonate/bicarbonate transport system substrate-binding protein